MRVDSAATSQDLAPSELETKLRARRIEHAARRCNDIGANTITWNGDDQMIGGTITQCRGERCCERLAHCIASRDPFVGALAEPDSSAASLFAAET